MTTDLEKSFSDSLELLLKSSKGEGSRGGKILAHTRAGKAIYDNPKHQSHKKFTASDHLDALNLHKRFMDLHDRKVKKKHGKDEYGSFSEVKKDKASKAHWQNYERHSDAMEHHKDKLNSKINHDQEHPIKKTWEHKRGEANKSWEFMKKQAKI